MSQRYIFAPPKRVKISAKKENYIFEPEQWRVAKWFMEYTDSLIQKESAESTI